MKRRTKLMMLVGVATLGVLFSVFAVTRYVQRDRYPRLSPEQAEAAYRAIVAEPEKAFIIAAKKAVQTPSAAAEAERQRAEKAYVEAMEKAERFEPYHYWPYRERLRDRLWQAARDLRDTGNVFRFVRGVRHALLPMLDRRSRQS
jgi:hypothetical protein